MGSYTFRAAGTVSSGSGSLTPGAPAGLAVGDLMLCATCARASTETLSNPSGWTRLLDTIATANDALILYGRIADGTGSDAFSGDWSGGSNSRAQIAAFYGSVYTDLATIVAHSNVAGSAGTVADIPNPAVTITTDGCLVIGVGKKSKTATSDGASVTSPAGLDNRIQLSWANGSTVGMVWDYTQQASAANISASIWDQSIEESDQYASLVVALKSAAATVTIDSYRGMGRGIARGIARGF